MLIWFSKLKAGPNDLHPFFDSHLAISTLSFLGIETYFSHCCDGFFPRFALIQRGKQSHLAHSELWLDGYIDLE
jgi:hypothetical protein